MRALLAPAAALFALACPVALTPQASAESTTLKAVIFEEVKPLYQKTDAGYEGLGVTFLNRSGSRPSAARWTTGWPSR